MSDDNNAVALWDFERNEKISFQYIWRNLPSCTNELNYTIRAPQVPGSGGSRTREVLFHIDEIVVYQAAVAGTSAFGETFDLLLRVSIRLLHCRSTFLLCFEHVDHRERIASRGRPAFSSHLVSRNLGRVPAWKGTLSPSSRARIAVVARDSPAEQYVLHARTGADVVNDQVMTGLRRSAVDNHSDVRNITSQVPSD